MSTSSRGSVIDNPTPRKKVLSEELNKQLILLTNQIDGLRAEVATNQQSLKMIQRNQTNLSRIKSKEEGLSLEVEPLNRGEEAPPKEDMSALFIGDIIAFNLSEDGLVYGDIRLNRLGVEHLEPDQSRKGGSTPNDAAFRLCPKLNYRTKREVSRAKSAGRSEQNETEKISDIRRKERLIHEQEQNDLLMQKVRGRGHHMPVVYGDIIQLEHIRSGRFIGLRKSHSVTNSNNQSAVLMTSAEEGPSCYFKVMPRFKVRGIGSNMFVGDEVIFESVVFDSVVLSASPDYCYPQAEPMPDLRVPLILQSPKRYEVNGCFKPIKIENAVGSEQISTTDRNVTSFRVHLFVQFTEEDSEFLNSFCHFRLFHFDFHGYLSASSNHDKGVTLDSLKDEMAIKLRHGNIHSHLPYLRPLKTQDPNHPVNMNAKSIWAFECIDPYKTGSFSYNTPLHIKHITTNKYLCVDSSSVARCTQDSQSLQGSFDNPANVNFFNCHLVSGNDPQNWESSNLTKDAIVFRVIATGNEGIHVRNATTTVRIEHRLPDGRRLYFSDVHDVKPKYIGEAVVEGKSQALSRVGFIERASGVEVLSLKPLLKAESALLDRVSSYIPCIKLYTHRFLSAKKEEDFPVNMCEQLVSLLLDLLDDLGKGYPTPRRFENVADFCTEANSLNESTFAQLFGGEINDDVQNLCIETKLLDALFEAVVAPYNQCFFKKPPFETPVTNHLPAAVQKYLYVCIQRILLSNQDSMEYFSSRFVRIWRSSTQREREPWRNLLVDQCEDGFGATVLLALLFKSSSRILHKIVNDDLLERFRSLIKKCGPHPRLISLFASTCWVEGRPVQSFQEACVRKLWMHEEDRYSIAATFHESTIEVLKEGLQDPYFYPYRDVARIDGTVSDLHLRQQSIDGYTPEHFLGKTEDNTWNPILVTWRSNPNKSWGATKGEEDRGGLYWTPNELGIPSVGSHYGQDGNYLGEYVPIEHLLWALEPGRLSEAVTGKKFEPFSQIKETSPAPTSEDFDSKAAKAQRKLRSEVFATRQAEEELFQRNRNLALYVTDQINLLTQTCRGRSYNSILRFEDTFTYEMLLNMATNPWLPYRFRAVVVQFTLSLYVDRFPQIPKCGSPHLPEQIWIYDDPEDTEFFSRKSTIPVVDKDLTCDKSEAIPEFFVPLLSSAHGRKDPFISMPHSSKFYLLNNLCVRCLGSDKGRVTYILDADCEGENKFFAALLNAQHFLLRYGFQSRIEMLKSISKSNALILDGRDDCETHNKTFEPKENRYKDMGMHSDAAVGIKKAIVDQMFDICDLQVNYRLARLFGKFKEKMSKGMDIKKWVSSVEMFYEFEGLFNIKSRTKYLDDSAQMDLAILCGKPDFEEALVDILMYEDSKLMAASLHLLDKCYGQRRRLVNCLNQSLLLQHPRIAVYGEIHSLRANVNELHELVNTHSVWGVNSVLSGDFDDKKYGRLMHITNTLIEFIYTEKLKEDGEPILEEDDFIEEIGVEMKEREPRGASIDRTPLISESTKNRVGQNPSNHKLEKPTISNNYYLRPQNVLVGTLLTHFQTIMPHVPMDSRVAQLFKQLDSSQDGRLSKDEVRDGIRRILEVNEEEINEDELTSIFDAMRSNGEDYVNYVAFEGFIEGGGENRNYLGQFLDCDRGEEGKIYSADRIWSTDVASVWTKRIRGEDGNQPLWPSKYHQHVLRSCNLQAVLFSAFAIEADIAFTGSKCTVALKVESQRRLTQAKTALLTLAKSFVTGDFENQEILSKELRLIQGLATPTEIKKDADEAGFDERLNGSLKIKPCHYNCFVITGFNRSPAHGVRSKKVSSTFGASRGEGFPVEANQKWPGSIREMAQDLLIGIFRGNEKLCLRLAEGTATDPLLDVLAFAANQASTESNMNVDTCPILDFFFNLCMPTTQRTLQEFQLYTAKMLMTNFDGLREAAGSCIRRISASLKGKKSLPNENPYRMARLLRAVMANGNDRTAIFVSNGAQGIEFSELCEVVLAHVVRTKAGKDNEYFTGLDLIDMLSPRKDIRRATLSSSITSTSATVPAKPFGVTINREIYELGGLNVGGVSDLLMLLVELADLLPLSEREVRSPEVWNLMRRVTMPALDYLANIEDRPLFHGERVVNAALIDFLDSLLTKIDTHGLLEALLAEQYRAGENMIEDMRDDLRSMKDHYFFHDCLSSRSRDAVDRIVLRCSGRGELINNSKINKDIHIYPDQEKISGRSLSKAYKIPSFSSFGLQAQDFYQQVSIFRTGISKNKHIQKAIQRRRFELLTKLENGVPADTKKYPGAADVVWEKLVRRMAVYALDRSSSLVQDTDIDDHDGQEICEIIFRLLKDHLIKARTWPLNEDGERVVDANGKNSFNDPSVVDLKLLDPEDLSTEDRQSYVDKQLALLDNGIVQLLLEVIIMRNSDEEDGDLADMSLEVLDEVQLGGNEQVRQVLYDYTVTKDVDGRLLQCLTSRIERSIDSIVEAKNFGVLGNEGDNMTEEVQAVLADSNQTIIFMTNLCVGHYSDFQELLREQPMYTGRTFDLVGMSIELLCEMAESQNVVEHLGKEEIELVQLLLNFLVVVMMGPRSGNQLKIAMSDVAIALNSIIPAQSVVEQTLAESDSSYITMQALSFKVLSACLEARVDTECHRPLRTNVDMKLLCKCAIVLDNEARSLIDLAFLENRLLSDKEQSRINVVLEALTQIWILHYELFPELPERETLVRLMGSDESYLSEKASALAGNDVKVPEQLKEAPTKNEDVTSALSRKPLIGVIEIAWDRRVHRTCFPLPLESRYLTAKTKEAFLAKARLLTTERRMAMMFGLTDIFVAEMEWVRVLSERFWLYRLIGNNLDGIKAVMYALAVLLNLNVLMSPPELNKPFENYFVDGNNLSASLLMSLRITFILGFFNFLGYFVIMTVVAVTTVPIMIRETDKRTERCKQTMDRKDFTDIMAFKWWFVTLVFNIGFIIMHMTNFPQHRKNSTTMYSYLIFGINLPWTLSCVRNYIVVPASPPQRLFVIVFDTLVTKPFFRNHLILQSLSIQGFLNTQYFTLMLFDIVNLSDRLANIVQALSFHGESLGLVFYLFVSTAFTYASFGLQFFPEAFSTTFDGVTVQFKTVLSCFWFIFYNFSNRGNLKAVLAPSEPKSADWLARILFDAAFFIWVGIILFTSITALLVDALGKARMDAAKREHEVRNVCFVCGMTRTIYDDFGLKPGSASYDDHCEKDHDPWIYVSYVAYLRKKVTSQLSGIESFVKHEIDKQGSWVPSKTCFVLESQGKKGVEEDDSEDESHYKDLLEKFGVVEKQISDVVMLHRDENGSNL